MNKKKIFIMLSIVSIGLVAIFCIWYFFWGKNKTANSQQTAVKIETSIGQEIVFAQITSVKGNEITYTVAEEAGENSSKERPAMSEEFDGEKRPAMPDVSGNGERPAMPESFEGGKTPQMPGNQGNNISGGDQMIGGRVGNRGNATNGDRSGRGGMTPGGSAYAFSYDGTNYQLMEESRTELIPVGTDVITKLGTVTTFSRLAAGDNVALVVEKDGDEQVIVSVYIIG